MSGLYAADGSINVTVVSGAATTGLQAADGSYNVVVSPGGQAGLYNKCGAYNVTAVTGSQKGYYAPDGSVNVYASLGRNLNTQPGTPVTVVSGTLFGPTVPSGLISYWPLDTSTTTGSTSTDIIGTNNGLSTATSIVTGQVAQAYNFNGSTAKVVVPTAANINFTGLLPFSICTWLNPGAFIANGFQSIIGNADTAGNIGYEIAIVTPATNPATTTQYQVYLGVVFPTNCILFTTSSGSVTAGVNQHIVLTYTGNQNFSGMLFYINGTPATLSVANNSLSSSTASPANITQGNSSRTAPNPYLGWLDDIRLYNRVLTPTEVTSIFNAGSAGHR